MSAGHAIVAPAEIWGAWSLDPVAAAILLAAALAYGQGVRRLWTGGRRRAVSLRQVGSFYAGLAALALAFLSPLDALAATLFSAHMVQHLLLLLVAPCLLVYGAPAVPVALALPAQARRAAFEAARSPVVQRAMFVVSAPIAVWTLHTAAMWLWHLPALYEGALQNEALHVIEHASFAATAIAFWSIVITVRRAGAPHGVRIALVFTTALQSGALGAILTFASVALYSVHGPGAQAWGVTQLQDQQLAGVIMWVPVGIVYFVTMSVLFIRWMKGMEGHMRRAEASEGAARRDRKRDESSPVRARFGEQ